MNEDDIVVVKEEHHATYRQHIRPKTQESVPALFAALLKICRQHRITGPLTINFNDGGVRSLIYDQVATIRTGSAADIAVEELFAKQATKNAI